jgi:hypothetical protein
MMNLLELSQRRPRATRHEPDDDDGVNFPDICHTLPVDRENASNSFPSSKAKSILVENSSKRSIHCRLKI